MRKATAEQKALAQERRDKMRAIAKTIGAMTEPQRLELVARCSIRTIEGRELSVKNQCLLITQRPNVSVVGGFQQWLKAGRCVKKGEQSAGIFVPCTRKAQAEHSETTEEGSETFFVIGRVFDISQTKPLDEPDANEESAPAVVMAEPNETSAPGAPESMELCLI